MADNIGFFCKFAWNANVLLFQGETTKKQKINNSTEEEHLIERPHFWYK